MAENGKQFGADQKDEQSNNDTSTGVRKTRSPAYPGINLETAIKRARELYSQDKMNPVPVPIAVKRWGFAEKSSGGLVTVAAMKSFGLLRDSGSGKDRKVQLTDEARRIILDTRPESAERDNLIRQIALGPKIHALMWNKWAEGLPADDTLRHSLIFDYDFNENAVSDFIREYKDTIRFAKVSKSDTMSEDAGESGGIQVGDYVQWESQGILQFPSPRRVTGFSNDRSHAFVEGTSTGFPVSQLSKSDPVPPVVENPRDTPPTSKRVQQKAGMNTEIFTLDEGEVTLQWPSQLSQASYEDFKSWLDLIVRKAKRAAEKSEALQSAPSSEN